MRISLEPNGEVFSKQVAALRKHLDSLHMKGGQEGVSARIMKPTLVPFLTVMRTELRDEVMPDQVMRGVADLLANLAMTAVQSLTEAPAPAEMQMVEQLLTQAIHTACQSIIQEAAGKKPKLMVVPKVPEEPAVIHNQTKGE